ncbi:MAG: septum formation initiator family protein [candidate division FCPU426 bacterium]
MNQRIKIEKNLRRWMDDLRTSPRKKKTRRSLGLAAAAAVSYWIFGGSQGLFALATTYNETWSLKREIRELEKAHADLVARQASLSRDTAYYEKFAREKLNLKGKGEITFRFDRHP